ncbi:hypothetical protein FPANT_12545 [Fusarium pseudoanthophilum]|uniref:Alpha/beta hydrolase fold-3 domain-containing protein n=1 Tax=Fusarium pseudoanthophilum TaxID=48495 RepID=A0A8H5NPH0_9HYPO|nr:hypothetical protein FPANT_12545 [Fusarium pseudoanthophilum]
MARAVAVILRHPIRFIHFSYAFVCLLLVVFLRRILLPHFPSYQSLRIQIHRAFLSASATTFPDLPRRLPVGKLNPAQARIIFDQPTAYVIPGGREPAEFLDEGLAKDKRCVVLYAHGGGYARGEARMYVDYMQRWIKLANEQGLGLVFVSVEYPLSTESAHPSQMRAFLRTYENLLQSGVPPGKVVFMGDSAGGGLSILSGIELLRLGLPQPAATVLVSPWIDMAMTAYEGGNPAVETDYFIMANEAVPRLTRLFVGDFALDSPEVNPLSRQPEEINGLSPQLILAGAAEFALYDSKAWAKLCETAKVHHQLHVEWGQLHIYAMGSRWIDPVIRKRTDLKIISWIAKHLK